MYEKATDIFQRFSLLNFPFSELREAAERFLELDHEIRVAERRADQEHEHQDFEVCQECALRMGIMATCVQLTP